MTTTPAELRAVGQSASTWPQFPSLYEINTWVWISELNQKYGQTVDLSCVPRSEWDAIAAFGFDAVWLMGVWERSPVGIAIANRKQALLEDFQRALPDFRSNDNVGSPYCVRRYVVDDYLGGPEGLAVARRELSKRGMNLLLDFVPNHVAPDHPWVAQHPEYFIRGSADELRNAPSSYMEVGGTIFACGRDPYFPAWEDVLQLNAFQPDLRRAVIETLSTIAEQCDGVRCDMAMLLLNSIFERTWDGRAGARPAKEFWPEVISSIKKKHPEFLFIAEAYWNLEWELEQQGFDYCYDKTLYDRLEHGGAENIRLHLCADLSYQSKLLRFIENHDEPRAATAFFPAKRRAAALVASTLPGTRLFHEGQFEGRKVRLPVFLGRRPAEHFDRDLHGFYTALLEAINRPVFHWGEWTLCDRAGWPDNESFRNLVAWTWVLDDEHYLIAVNLSDRPVQARIQIPWADVGGELWHLLDLLSGALYEWDGDKLLSDGLYVELGPWNYHFFHRMRVSKQEFDTILD
ncbi:MAG: alpha-amylase family glycosyl hydrolase [Candidatus Sulfotelmatobacter sp.]